MSCRLCSLKKATPWFYDGDNFVIITCDTCGVPMIVVREHTMDPSAELKKRMINKAENIFGEGIEFRTNQRDIKDHWHWHIEKW